MKDLDDPLSLRLVAQLRVSQVGVRKATARWCTLQCSGRGKMAAFVFGRCVC